MKNISLKLRLIIPIAFLGIVAVLSNLLSIINIQNVNTSAANIADNYMDSKSRLSEICQSSMNIHKMALSHIVATDYDTMTTLVQQIKQKEALLDNMLAEYEYHIVYDEEIPLMERLEYNGKRTVGYEEESGIQQGTADDKQDVRLQR